MRNMSFSLTTAQFLDGSKTITRRLGWDNLRPGEHFMAVEKSQGLKKGEHVKRLGECVCLSNIPWRLKWINKFDVICEGFPHLSPIEFIAMFCKHMKCKPATFVNRIEFRRVNSECAHALPIEQDCEHCHCEEDQEKPSQPRNPNAR